MGGHLALDAGTVLAAVVLLVALVFGVLTVRRWLFVRAGGTVECSLRELRSAAAGSSPDGASPDRGSADRASVGGASADGPAGPWRLGFGRYKGDVLQWHRVFGFRRRPRQVIHRRGLVVAGRRVPQGEEAAGLLPDVTIVEVRDGGRRLELAMGASALTGFLAWLEAAPPGSPVDSPVQDS
ncbi:DUF2550 domain-containing protein [Actinomadura harenae]|uniref:DUF2550 family protein n=1 Tax=Actinomadura harenae TaxID=2483351 RepID=A0A3M2M7F1_9ACTN|nr:DUF2550 domain-containing protein [Actinomadura harenae]RMI45734.1 DUF2550 family protein [Actinomadura harenae]